MKKILVSLLMIAGIAGTASAKMKMKVRKANAPIPYALNPNIDHTKDVAYSAAWADRAVSPAPDANFTLGALPSVPYLAGKTFYYSYPLSNYTIYGSYPVSMNGPYMGQDAPSYDGALRNRYRNMRANNESEPLPPNSGEGK